MGDMDSGTTAPSAHIRGMMGNAIRVCVFTTATNVSTKGDVDNRSIIRAAFLSSSVRTCTLRSVNIFQQTPTWLRPEAAHRSLFPSPPSPPRGLRHSDIQCVAQCSNEMVGALRIPLQGLLGPLIIEGNIPDRSDLCKTRTRPGNKI